MRRTIADCCCYNVFVFNLSRDRGPSTTPKYGCLRLARYFASELLLRASEQRPVGAGSDGQVPGGPGPDAEGEVDSHFKGLYGLRASDPGVLPFPCACRATAAPLSCVLTPLDSMRP